MKVVPPTTNEVLRLGRPLNVESFSSIRRSMILDHFKWDPQVGDESVLLEQPLILSSKTWVDLTAAAERMARDCEH